MEKILATQSSRISRVSRIALVLKYVLCVYLCYYLTATVRTQRKTWYRIDVSTVSHSNHSRSRALRTAHRIFQCSHCGNALTEIGKMDKYWIS